MFVCVKRVDGGMGGWGDGVGNRICTSGSHVRLGGEQTVCPAN